MGLQGKIIEYVDHGKFICAYVQEDLGKRLRLLNQNKRELNLPFGRLVHQNSKAETPTPKEQILNALKLTSEKRQALMSDVSLEDIWELAVQEDESAFAASFLTELSFGGETNDDHVAAFLRCVFQDKLFFKYKDGKVQVHGNDVVEQLRTRLEKEKEKEAFLENSARALIEIMEGSEKGCEEWPERDRCLQVVEDFYLFGSEAQESALARELLKKAGLTRPHDPYWLLIRAGVWQKDENVGLRRYEVPMEFSQEALDRVDEIGEPTAEELLTDGRRDLRHLDLFTIDGPRTRDFDDALHLEKKDGNYHVGIHIADVSQYVRPGDPLFKDAQRRGTSLYFADNMVPMLPPALSENVCSLIAGKDRAAVSFLVTLSPEGEVIDYKIVSSVVQVKKKLTYDEVDGLVEGDELYRTLFDLTIKLQERRVEAGALILPVPDVNISVASDGDVSVKLSPVDTPGRSLVAECMVLANSLAAQYLADRETPGLFRGQDPPRKHLLKGVTANFYLIYRQRKFLSRGKLTINAQPHSGVGVMQYTTLTSPIRRFLDLLMQQQLISMLKHQGGAFFDWQLEEFSGAILSLQTRANMVSQKRHRYWLLKYLEQRVGQRLEAMVLDRGPKKVIVVLSDILLESELPANQGVSAEPGETIRVKIAKASPLDDVLRLEW